MSLTINLDEEIAGKLTLKSLKDTCSDLEEDLEKVRNQNEALGIMSWDYEEEVEMLENAISHFEFVLAYYEV